MMADPRLDPEIAAFIAGVNADWAKHPPLAELSMPQARAAAEAVRTRWRQGGPVMAGTREQIVETGAGPLRIRLYRPESLVAVDAPALIYVHGGGFVFFSLDTHDRLMREYAAQAGVVVIGVDYPLSPEAKFPRALTLISDFMRWLGANAATLGVDARRLTMAGDSVGANLSVTTCLTLRDAGWPVRVRGILCNYGAFSGRCSDAAEAEFGGPEAVLTRAEMEYFYAAYLDDPAQLDDPLACPLVAEVAGLPPMFLVIPELDVLTEQSFMMRDRLTAAGVPVEAKIYAGATHSFLEAMSIAAVARDAIADGADFLRRVSAAGAPSLP
jgi:acetyl esterase